MNDACPWQLGGHGSAKQGAPADTASAGGGGEVSTDHGLVTTGDRRPLADATSSVGSGEEERVASGDRHWKWELHLLAPCASS